LSNNIFKGSQDEGTRKRINFRWDNSSLDILQRIIIEKPRATHKQLASEMNERLQLCDTLQHTNIPYGMTKLKRRSEMSGTSHHIMANHPKLPEPNDPRLPDPAVDQEPQPGDW
jgi:hypothetical protein